MRVAALSFVCGIALIGAGSASAQRQAPVSQGVTTGQVAQSLNDLQSANADLSAKVTALESENATLLGSVETLQFLLTQSREQINQMQVDDAALDRLVSELEATIEQQDDRIDKLERRLNQIALKFDEMAVLEDPADPNLAQQAELDDASGEEDRNDDASTGEEPTQLTSSSEPTSLTGPSGMPQGSLGTLPASELPGEAGPLFAEAKSRLLQFDYAGAEAAFRSFLDRFGDDPQAGEAQYWLGEVLYQQDQYAASGQAYTKMIREYPDDPRAPEALAKLARSMRLIGDTDRACSALAILPQRYPNASGVTKNLAAGERARAGCET